MIFASDNWAPAHPEVLSALIRANDGAAPAYGGDPLTRRVEDEFRSLFERDVAVFFVATGGAANSLALSVLIPPYAMVFCHEESHIQLDECGAPEFFTGGAKLVPIKGNAGKLSAQSLDASLKGYPVRPPHGMPARVVSITQASECGTVYSNEEVAAISAVARTHGLKLHMDGARFANALATLGCSPAEATWKAGVDVLSFGGTKNGCLAAEAVVFFAPEDAADFAYRRKRGGHLWSKMRYLSAQFEAYLADGLWLRLSAHANAMARRLSAGLTAVAGCKVWYPTQANEVFVTMPDAVVDRLATAGATFYPWRTPGDPAEGAMHRLICSWATTEAEVDALLAAAVAALRK